MTYGPGSGGYGPGGVPAGAFGVRGEGYNLGTSLVVKVKKVNVNIFL